MRNFINIITEGQNSDLINQAKSLGIASDNIGELRDLEKLNKFHGSFMDKVKDRAQMVRAMYDELLPKLRESGKLPFEIGTRFTTPKSIETGTPPWQVTGYYIDPKNPRRYGYRVEREDEKSTMLVSDPDADARMKTSMSEWDRAAHVAQWKPLTGPRG